MSATVVQVNISCDMGRRCRAATTWGDRVIPAGRSEMASTPTVARKRAREAGWGRERVRGVLLDLCPACAAWREGGWRE